MTDALFVKIVDELGALDFQGKLALYSNNEPLLDDKLVERVRYARAQCPKAYLFIYTNGTRLNTDLAWQLVMAGIDLIRIDNYSDRLKLHRNIARLVRDFQRPPYSAHATKIRVVVRKLNEVLSNRGGKAPNKLPEYASSHRCFQSSPCRYPFEQLVIRPDGKVSLCGNDAYGQVTLGDAAHQSLTEIWFGDAFRHVRTELTTTGRKNLAVCRECDVHTFDPDVLFGRTRLLRALNQKLNFSSFNWK